MKKKKMMILAVVVAMMALPMTMNAQGLFCRQNNGQARYVTKNEAGAYGMLSNGTRGLYSPAIDNPGVGNQGFGQDPEAPLGSGVIMLIAAGAGYAFIQSKKSKK